LPDAAGSYISVDIAVDSQAFPSWKQPVRTHFRHEGASWKLVGLERLPDSLPSGQVAQKATR
jgi:hypothetical protein